MKLSVNLTFTHTVLDSRVKNFPVGYLSKEEIPVLPNSSFSCLVTKHFHNKLHRDVDTTVTITRSEFWIHELRKIVSSIEGRCRICIEKRKHYLGQVMGDLPY